MTVAMGRMFHKGKSSHCAIHNEVDWYPIDNQIRPVTEKLINMVYIHALIKRVYG